jgi:hypothetical protein
MKNAQLIPAKLIENKILLIRGQKVLLDRDLAILYNIATRDLNKAVSRNISRFPNDFMFQLSKEEFEELKFQIGTSSLPYNKANWDGSRKLPNAFTEQGVAMLFSVLRSERAVIVNIQIMRVPPCGIKLREILSTHKELAQKLKDLELKIESHDEQITAIFEAINQLLIPPGKSERKIGFGVEEKKYHYSYRRK